MFCLFQVRVRFVRKIQPIKGQRRHVRNIFSTNQHQLRQACDVSSRDRKMVLPQTMYRIYKRYFPPAVNHGQVFVVSHQTQRRFNRCQLNRRKRADSARTSNPTSKNLLTLLSLNALWIILMNKICTIAKWALPLFFIFFYYYISTFNYDFN